MNCVTISLYGTVSAVGMSHLYYWFGRYIKTGFSNLIAQREKETDDEFRFQNRSRRLEKKAVLPHLTTPLSLGIETLDIIFNDKAVRDIDFPELEPCSECSNDILSFPLREFTRLRCGHIFHRSVLEKKLLLTVPKTCQFPDCGKNVDTLEQADAIGICFQYARFAIISIKWNFSYIQRDERKVYPIFTNYTDGRDRGYSNSTSQK